MLETRISAKRLASSCIEFPDRYTKHEIKDVYEMLKNDKRIEIKTRNELLNSLRKIYKSY